jgi:low temperature requirement protein LtrA
MGDRAGERGSRVTSLELFFDLVLVSAFTQVTTFLSHDPTWTGLVRALLLLGALWWAWAAYAWLTNTLDPEEGSVRLAMFAAIGAMLIVSLAVPDAFGATGVIFGVAYLVVRVLHVVLYAIAGRGDRDLFRAILRLAPAATIAPVLLLVAGFADGPTQTALWIAALAIDYLGVLLGRMRGWRVSPEHFVERFGLIIIIALGESIVAIGVGASGLPLDAGVITAALLGVTVAACLWWSYFDWVVYVAEATLVEATGGAARASRGTRTRTFTSRWSPASSCSPSAWRRRSPTSTSRSQPSPRSVCAAGSACTSSPTWVSGSAPAAASVTVGPSRRSSCSA